MGAAMRGQQRDRRERALAGRVWRADGHLENDAVKQTQTINIQHRRNWSLMVSWAFGVEC
jgi:hypothetical protein